MSEFDGYLEALRAELDVNPKRAEEICAEARGHLEARAKQLQETGLSREDAVRKAMESFGDAREVAARLAAANRRHRSVGAFRLVLSFAVAFGGMLVAFGLLEGNAPFLAAMTRPIVEPISPLGVVLSLMVMAVLTVPPALLAGLLAGRRHWWIAGTPPALWGLLMWGLIGIDNGLGGRPIEWDEAVGGGVLVLVCGPVLAAFGLVGARLSERRIGGIIVRLLGIGYLGVFGVMALFLQVHDLVGLLAVIATVLLVLCLLGAVALWARGRRWRGPAVLSSAACLLATISLVRVPTRGLSADFQVVRELGHIIVGEAALALVVGVVILSVWRRGKRESRAQTG